MHCFDSFFLSSYPSQCRVIVSGWLERRRLQTEKEEMEIIGDLDGKFKAAFIYSHSYLGGFVSIIVCEPLEWNRCLHRD